MAMKMADWTAQVAGLKGRRESPGNGRPPRFMDEIAATSSMPAVVARSQADQDTPFLVELMQSTTYPRLLEIIREQRDGGYLQQEKAVHGQNGELMAYASGGIQYLEFLLRRLTKLRPLDREWSPQRGAEGVVPQAVPLEHRASPSVGDVRPEGPGLLNPEEHPEVSTPTPAPTKKRRRRRRIPPGPSHEEGAR